MPNPQGVGATPANMPPRRGAAPGNSRTASRDASDPVSDQLAIVQWWNAERGFGMVKIDSSNTTAFVHFSTIPGTGYRHLVSGERVTVSARPDFQGRLTVDGLSFPEGRQSGVVAEYDHLKGYGRIAGSAGASIFVHHTDILHPDHTRASLESGEKVTLDLESSDKGPHARNVKRLDPRPPLNRFVRIPVEMWQVLADLAEDDVWVLRHPDADDDSPIDIADAAAGVLAVAPQADLPVLRSYIQHTFARILEQGKVAYGSIDGSDRAGFNTGLVTPNQEEIYGVLAAKSDEDGYPWRLVDWMKQSDGRIAGVFSPRPARATYWNDPSVLFYDPKLPLILDWDHFVNDNLSRYPADLQYAPTALMLTRSAVDRAVERVERNYKAAVPQFHRGDVQLLLPLALRGTAEAQLALVVRRVGNEYHGETVLPLAAALKNARLLARPDRDWLNP
nr:hypothetical protein GCM10020063_010200 [Dactylosporangium thailandense]